MTYKVSKELLDNVLETKSKNITFGGYGNTIMYYDIDSYITGSGSINIFEFAHKCRIWATEKMNYNIHEVPNQITAHSMSIEDIEAGAEHYLAETYLWDEQRLFDVCEWILKQKGLK